MHVQVQQAAQEAQDFDHEARKQLQVPSTKLLLF
jgi:hypothetical protein